MAAESQIHVPQANGSRGTEIDMSAHGEKHGMSDSRGLLGISVAALLALAALQETVRAQPFLEEDRPDDWGLAATAGPDLLTADLFSPKNWYCDPSGVVDINAYSFGTAVCNIGDVWVNWFGNSSDHPVVTQDMYRLKDGRFEQIGMSWAKHMVFVPSYTTICSGAGGCTRDTTGQHLGVGCSDSSLSSHNGAQTTLGPRSEVNAATGEIVWPLVTPPDLQGIDRRLQVHNADLDPELNAGAFYYIEGHHIAADDAGAGNGNNNASYRPALVTEWSENCYQISTDDDAQDGMPAILAWQERDPLVSIEYVDVPGDGRFILGSRVSALGDGMWHYEYALQNLNSDRAGQYFSVPLEPDVTFDNIDFHDVDYHSGSIYDTTDWTIDTSGGLITWASETFAENPDANALRWGTLYNFRFDAEICPVSGSVTLGLLKPGDPTSVAIPAPVPGEAVMIVSGNPPDGAIDARQPLDPDDSSATGWQHFDLTVTNCASSVLAADFLVEQDGGSGSVPTIDDVDPIDKTKVAISLSRPINVSAWTVITHDPSGTSLQVGYLPADVDGDGVSEVTDVAAWIDAATGFHDPLPAWSTDIDRSSIPDSEDLLRLMDLLNGAGDFESYLGATLP